MSLPELVVVVAILAVLAAIALPKLHDTARVADLRSARASVAALLATARATAVQRGRETAVVRHGNALVVAVAMPGGPEVVQSLPVDAMFRATLAASRDSLVYDVRGFARADDRSTYVIASGDSRDSVCVSARGAVLGTGCAP